MRAEILPEPPTLPASLRSTTWVCRSCSEVIGYLGEQPAPAACPNCRGTRLSAVLDAPRAQVLTRLRAA